jgi:hypothetical protein
VRPSLRFLALVLIVWAAIRAGVSGALPGAELFQIGRSEAKPPPIVATQFPPIDPPVQSPPEPVPNYAVLPVQSLRIPIIYSAQVSPPVALERSDTPRASKLLFTASDWALDDGPFSRPVVATPRSINVMEQPKPAQPVPPLEPALDRLQLASWAMLRSQRSGIGGSRSLASGGQLGASQTGIRLIYNLDRRVALTARTSSEVGRRGGEVAAGLRFQPLGSLPLWITAERRQAIGSTGGGRNAFAFFAEGGIYGRQLPFSLSLDAYGQGGFVGIHSRDLFVDGGLSVTRPFFRRLSAGFGIWAAAQPKLYRVDAGPRLTVKVRSNLRVHADWRQRLAGNARPGSGPALTLAGDF